MTAPTINGSAYPRSVDELMPEARDLATQAGEVPSRNRLMQALRIGVPKADEIRARLIGERSALVPVVGMDPEPDHDGQVLTAHLMKGGIPDWPLDTGPAEEPNEAPEDGAYDTGTQAPDTVTAPVRRRWWRRNGNRKSLQTPVGHPGTKITVRPVPALPEPASNDTVPVNEAPEDGAYDTGQNTRQLLRIRWGVRAVLVLGVAASIAGNVLHARDELISQIISAWSPLALLLAIELISRVPVHRRLLAVGRWLSTALIAGIAAWVSYWHMAAVASRYGEVNGSQYLLPLSVDGLVVVASICLVELGGRISGRKAL